MSKYISFSDRKQTFWQLACIAGSALGLPGMIVGGQLAHQYGAGTAFISICTGNLILWLFGIGFISMSRSRNAIENIRDYLGKKTGSIATLMLTLAFLIWYSVQISGSALILSNLFKEDSLLEIGVLLGLLIAILGMGGIILIRRICVYSMPLLLVLLVMLIGHSDADTQWSGSFSFSMPGVFAVMLIWLPGIVNLPTLFRHAESKTEAILGISLMTVFHILLQTFPIFLGVSDLNGVISSVSGFHNSLILILLLVSYVCINLVNLYLGSAGLEVMFSKLKGERTYFTFGIIGTLTFGMVQFYSHWVEFSWMMSFLEVLAGSFIGNLAIVLSVNYLLKLVDRNHFESHGSIWINSIWIVGCLTTIFVQWNAPIGSDKAFVIGINTAILAVILLGFSVLTIKSWEKLRGSR